MHRLAYIALLLGLLFPLGAEAANRFLTCATACTITASDTTIWGTTSGGIGASVPGSSDAVVLDAATCVGGVTCTATMGAAYNPTWQSITMGACTASTTGCIFDWSVNNNNVTLTASVGFNGTGTGTRNLKMGNGTWTISSTLGTAWNIATTTNLTFTANSSTIAFTGVTASNRTMSTGSLTYSTVSISANASGGSFSLAGAPTTISTLSIAAPNFVTFTASATTTISNAFTWTGTSSNQISINSSAVGTTATIAAAASSTSTWSALRDMTFTGSPTATNAFNLGNNSGITITPPATGGGGRIIGGWLLRRDLYHDNDNNLAWLERAA